MAGIEIFIDAYAVEARVAKMIETIKVLPVPQEFIAWQAEDMNRTRPSAEATGPTSMFTMIYPRARRRAVWKRTRAPATGKKPVRNRRAFRIAGRNVGTKRPILRPELYERLQERMNMLLRQVKW